jgi:polysaccharide pyruvyl transferase WcaK-like protein
VFFWAGATGLSDYPDRACELLSAARRANCRRIIWNVGMNSELNPAKYRLLGKRRRAADLADSFTLGLLHVRRRIEGKMVAAARIAIRDEVDDCTLVVTRDPESAAELKACGVSHEVLVGADSALIETATPWPPSSLGAEDALALERPIIRRVALCISAQRQITRWTELVAAIDRILADATVEIVGIPMNPITDHELLVRLKADIRQPERLRVITGVIEPGDILAILGKMDAVISSRLHLLILASIHNIPLIGISRGSKVDNFLAPFGLETVGSVEACDFDKLVQETFRLLASRAEFGERSQKVRHELLARLDNARRHLRPLLAE